MKTLQITLLLLAAVLTSPALAADQPLSLSMSIPPSESGEYHLDPYKVPHFHVILSNCSNKPVKVWAPQSEASNRALTFEFTDESGNKSQAGWEDQGGISHKLPDICSLRPGESLVLDVPYSAGSGWKGWPKIAGHLPTVKMQAAYQTSSRAQARGVWVGRLVSEPLTVTFYPK